MIEIKTRAIQAGKTFDLLRPLFSEPSPELLVLSDWFRERGFAKYADKCVEVHSGRMPFIAKRMLRMIPAEFIDSENSLQVCIRKRQHRDFWRVYAKRAKQRSQALNLPKRYMSRATKYSALKRQKTK